MNILIIEDDNITLDALHYSIKNLGHSVYRARNGKEAIDIMKSQKLDLLISDIMMPGISGLSLIRVIRSVHGCNVPIILISSLNNKPLLDAAFEEGANDFLAKPFSAEHLADKLRQYAS